MSSDLKYWKMFYRLESYKSTVYISKTTAYLIISNWKIEFPWEESITTTSKPLWTKASNLCLSSSRVPMAAPTKVKNRIYIV